MRQNTLQWRKRGACKDILSHWHQDNLEFIDWMQFVIRHLSEQDLQAIGALAPKWVQSLSSVYYYESKSIWHHDSAWALYCDLQQPNSASLDSYGDKEGNWFFFWLSPISLCWSSTNFTLTLQTIVLYIYGISIKMCWLALGHVAKFNQYTASRCSDWPWQVPTMLYWVLSTNSNEAVQLNSRWTSM